MRKKQPHSLQIQFFYPNYYDRCTITGEIKCSVAPPSAGGGGGTEASCHAPLQAFLVPSSHIVSLARLSIVCSTKGDSANVKGAVFREQRGGGAWPSWATDSSVEHVVSRRGQFGANNGGAFLPAH